MNILESAILGAVQGLTEFLPVSSSGHLQIAKALLGVEIEENLAFDITLHAATVLSTFVVLRSEIRSLFTGLFTRGFNEQKTYILKLIISMIPIGIVGFACKDYIDMMLASQHILAIVGVMLLITAALLAFACYARTRSKQTISYRDSFIIGMAQAAAAMPGLSRSGTTIATGLLLGNNREAVAKFSFLMVLAPVIGEMLLDAVKGEAAFSSIGLAPMAAGFISAFVVGCLACRFMIGLVKNGRLVWFALYCAAAGTASIIFDIFLR